MGRNDLFKLETERMTPVSNSAAAPTPRQWLVAAERELHPLLPDQRRPVLTTNKLLDDAGRPIDVYAAFDRDINKMQGLVSNWWAIKNTAQSIEPGYAIEKAPAVWPGFESVWIPVAKDVQLHGFLGLARCNGQPVRADCIVVLPGLWGDNGAKRSRDVSKAFLSAGYHVLSLEPRGHGQTEARYPNAHYAYQVMESQDLMRVSEWLQDTYPQIRETGATGFCWGANAALLAAWYDGRDANDPSLSPRLRGILDPPNSRRHFAAGAIAFSPVIRYEHFIERMDTPKSKWVDPSPAMFQESTRDHMIRKGFANPSGSLRKCIEADFAHSADFGPSFSVDDAYQMLRLLPHRGMPANHKLERARVPVLIVHSVNDPLQTAQEVADLIAETNNPNVTALMLPGGGHIGFQAYSRRYFYSLIMNFFDPKTGAAAMAGTTGTRELAGVRAKAQEPRQPVRVD
jgi:predicted alpha/beta-fold hydrolase